MPCRRWATAWRDLVGFRRRATTSASLGEIALAVLPPELRELTTVQLARRLKRAGRRRDGAARFAPTRPPRPRPSRQAALARIDAEAGPFLLLGGTGSGKTEVYLRSVAALLAREPHAQALVMVPEINLTPQLEARFTARFGAVAVVSLHSGLTPSAAAARAGWRRTAAARASCWARAWRCSRRCRALRLIVVDEEHDPCYKQQEGARYSARDLAVWRGRREGAKVMLGSATPSLESWHQSRPPRARMRAGATSAWRCRRASAPAPCRSVRLVDMNLQPPAHACCRAPLLDAIGQRIARGEQSLVFLNRRGYAPVLHLRRLRLEERMPALQRLPRLPQDRPQPALPPLRLHRARAACVPGLRQPRHRAGRPRHRTAGGAPGRAVRRGHPARRQPGPHRAHRRRQHRASKVRWSRSSRRCTPATSTCSSARR